MIHALERLLSTYKLCGQAIFKLFTEQDELKKKINIIQ